MICGAEQKVRPYQLIRHHNIYDHTSCVSGSLSDIIMFKVQLKPNQNIWMGAV